MSIQALKIVKYLQGIWWGADPTKLLIFYKRFIRLIIEYASFIYFPFSIKSQIEKLERVQYSAIRSALASNYLNFGTFIIKPRYLFLTCRQAPDASRAFSYYPLSSRTQIVIAIAYTLTIDIQPYRDTGKTQILTFVICNIFTESLYS